MVAPDFRILRLECAAIEKPNTAAAIRGCGTNGRYHACSTKASSEEIILQIVVTSAAGANGDGYGQLLAFSQAGAHLGTFSDDLRISDPRGLRVRAERRFLYVNSGADRILALDPQGKVVLDSGEAKGLNPGGGNFAPDGRYCVGARTARSIAAFPVELDAPPAHILPPGIVPFPRGFAFGPDGRLFLASGIGPDGRGENTIGAFKDGELLARRFIEDPEVSPLDLAVGPNGNVLVSSEFPFGKPDATTTVREYDGKSGALARVFKPGKGLPFHRPRGLRFGPEGNLFCVAQDVVLAFDYANGKFLDAAVRFPRLNGQALEFFGD
jgi:DNA-binding beta-propeller fold protein YncE